VTDAEERKQILDDLRTALMATGEKFAEPMAHPRHETPAMEACVFEAGVQVVRIIERLTPGEREALRLAISLDEPHGRILAILLVDRDKGSPP
jgi:hypothetical protein